MVNGQLLLNCLLLATYNLLPATCYLRLTICYVLLTTCYLLLATYYLLPTACSHYSGLLRLRYVPHLLLTACYVLRATYYLLVSTLPYSGCGTPRTYYLLLTTTTCYLLFASHYSALLRLKDAPHGLKHAETAPRRRHCGQNASRVIHARPWSSICIFYETNGTKPLASPHSC